MCALFEMQNFAIWPDVAVALDLLPSRGIDTRLCSGGVNLPLDQPSCLAVVYHFPVPLLSPPQPDGGAPLYDAPP